MLSIVLQVSRCLSLYKGIPLCQSVMRMTALKTEKYCSNGDILNFYHK